MCPMEYLLRQWSLPFLLHLSLTSFTQFLLSDNVSSFFFSAPSHPFPFSSLVTREKEKWASLSPTSPHLQPFEVHGTRLPHPFCIKATTAQLPHFLCLLSESPCSWTILWTLPHMWGFFNLPFLPCLNPPASTLLAIPQVTTWHDRLHISGFETLVSHQTI